MPRNPRASDVKLQAGIRLRVAREALGMESQEAAKIGGVGKSAWSNYETGQRLPDVLAMCRFAMQTGVSLDWIYLENASALPESIRKKVGIM